jgi:organic radical activating enzyme
MGRPSLFMRLSRCNLACQWCDTAYTWRFTGDNRPHRDGLAFERRPTNWCWTRTRSSRGCWPIHRTGGGDRWRAAVAGPALARVLAALAAARPELHVEIETNGTVALPRHRSADRPVQRLAQARPFRNPADLALIPERLAAWAAEPRAFFKFVVASPDDCAEVAALQAQYAIPGARLFVMPEGTDSETLRRREKWLSALALEHGWRMTDRLHIHLYGDTRGTETSGGTVRRKPCPRASWRLCRCKGTVEGRKNMRSIHCWLRR